MMSFHHLFRAIAICQPITSRRRCWIGSSVAVAAVAVEQQALVDHLGRHLGRPPLRHGALALAGYVPSGAATAPDSSASAPARARCRPRPVRSSRLVPRPAAPRRPRASSRASTVSSRVCCRGADALESDHGAVHVEEAADAHEGAARARPPCPRREPPRLRGAACPAARRDSPGLRPARRSSPGVSRGIRKARDALPAAWRRDRCARRRRRRRRSGS